MSTSTTPGERPEYAMRGYAKPAGRSTAASRLVEAETIRLAQAGDVAAFETLYGLHKRRVYSLCRRMSGNEAEAEDLAQEVFLLVFRKLVNFRGQSAFSTWLHRVTVNVVLMRFRKKGLMAVSLQELLDPAEGETAKSDFGHRDEVLAGAVDRVVMERAIEDLPPGYRTVFVLFDIEGYEHNEIAAMLGCTIGNTKSQLHKARMKMRAILRRGVSGPEPAGVKKPTTSARREAGREAASAAA